MNPSIAGQQMQAEILIAILSGLAFNLYLNAV